MALSLKGTLAVKFKKAFAQVLKQSHYLIVKQLLSFHVEINSDYLFKRSFLWGDNQCPEWATCDAVFLVYTSLAEFLCNKDKIWLFCPVTLIVFWTHLQKLQWHGTAYRDTSVSDVLRTIGV